MADSPLVRYMRNPNDTAYCYWEEFTTKQKRPVITKRNPDKKGDYVLMCACDECCQVPLAKK